MNATYRGSYWQPGSRIISRNSESISTTVASIHDRLLPVNLSFISPPFPLSLSLSFPLQRSLSVRKETQREGWLVFPRRKHRIVARVQQNRFCELIVVTQRASIESVWFRIFLRRESRLVKLSNKATLSRPRYGRERKEKKGKKLGIKKKKEKENKSRYGLSTPGTGFPDGGEIGGVKCASCYGWEIKQLIR